MVDSFRRRSNMTFTTDDTSHDSSYGNRGESLTNLITDESLDKIEMKLKDNPQLANTPNRSGVYPVHLAVLYDRLPILSMLIERGADVNVLDNDHRTCLQQAILNNKPEIVALLLNNDADVTILDSNMRMPIHTAAKVGSTAVLKLLLPHYSNVDLVGDGGHTPLHYAAQFDNDEAVRLLIACGASIEKESYTGNYPIHLAGKSAAPKALEALIEETTELGYTMEEILQMRDREKNLPIHAAVIGGSPQAVACLLKCGARLLEEDGEGSNPILMAANSGNLELIKVMYEKKPRSFVKCLEVRDMLHRTPLHLSVIFNHETVTKYLLDKGADINAVDREGYSPLLLAAYKGFWGNMNTLLSYSADNGMRDRYSRNFLHLLICADIATKNFKQELSKSIKRIHTRLLERDDEGNTPLHYAVRRGHMMAFEWLLELKADVGAKNILNQTVFHIAAMYGRVKCFNTLLQAPNGASLKNDADSREMTPLHYAAQRGNVNIVTLLLTRGSVISRDLKSNTALHLAAEYGHHDCINSILYFHPKLVDIANIEGDTALHLAANKGHTSCVNILMSHGAKFISNTANKTFYDGILDGQYLETALAVVNHDRWTEVVTIPSIVYGTFLVGLIRKLPSVCVSLLDRCVTTTQIAGRRLHVINYDFRYLKPPAEYEQFAKANRLSLKSLPLVSLREMVRYNRVECLSHPLCMNYLRMKWRTYGYLISTLELLFYLAFLAVLTAFVVNVHSLQHTEPLTEAEVEAKEDLIPTWFGHITDVTLNHIVVDHLFRGETTSDYPFMEERSIKLMLTYILCYSFVNLVKELGNVLFQGPVRYLTSPLNFLHWMVFGEAIYFAFPFFWKFSTHSQWEVGMGCMFFSWFKLLVFMQRFDSIGIYIVMFLSIMKTIMTVVFIFFVLNIAFGLVFFMLLHNTNDHENRSAALSIYQTFVMIIEVDFKAILNANYHDDDPWTLHFDVLSYCILGLFTFVMPILFVNLLIGLAVGDIEAVRCKARLNRLATQVALHFSLERKFPVFERFCEDTYRYIPPNMSQWWIRAYYKIFYGGFANENFGSEDNSSSNDILKIKTKMTDLEDTVKSTETMLQKVLRKVSVDTTQDFYDEGPGYEDEHKKENKSLHPDLI